MQNEKDINGIKMVNKIIIRKEILTLSVSCASVTGMMNEGTRVMKATVNTYVVHFEYIMTNTSILSPKIYQRYESL